MIDVPMKSTIPFDRNTIISINQIKVQRPNSSSTLLNMNSSSIPNRNTNSLHATQSNSPNPVVPNQPILSKKPIPPLIHEIQKGQKFALPISSSARLKACIGWNVLNNNCDVDVSAFMLDASGKVLGDNWFVFYGQTQSPDNSTVFSDDGEQDREIIFVDMAKLNKSVTKIVFVLTINEALQKRLNFSMIQDAYIRMIDCSNNTELVSFKMTEYYANVTSMMIGELYLYNGNWKFNAVGNGVARDLAGLCELYGVQVV